MMKLSEVTGLLSDYEEEALKSRLYQRVKDSYPWRYVDIMPGWGKLIDRLDQEINLVDSGYSLQQVKIKWGGLRYYIVCDPDLRDDIDDIISQAETLANLIDSETGEHVPEESV